MLPQLSSLQSSAPSLDRWNTTGSQMRELFERQENFPQKVLQGKHHEITIPGNVSCNISSSKGTTVMLILLTHSEDCSRTPEAVVYLCQRMVEPHWKHSQTAAKSSLTDYIIFHFLDCKLHVWSSLWKGQHLGLEVGKLVKAICTSAIS